jgi:hypothetical protein
LSDARSRIYRFPIWKSAALILCATISGSLSAQNGNANGSAAKKGEKKEALRWTPWKPREKLGRILGGARTKLRRKLRYAAGKPQRKPQGGPPLSP